MRNINEDKNATAMFGYAHSNAPRLCFLKTRQ